MLCDNCKEFIPTTKNCLMCNKSFPRNGTQVYCGSIRKKTGCAYDRRMNKQLGYYVEKKERDKQDTILLQQQLPEQRAELVPKHHFDINDLLKSPEGNPHLHN